MNKNLCIVVLCLIIAGTAQAATLRVANNGEDVGGCGGASMPCRSISFAIDEANEGDVILVDAGRYSFAGGETGGVCNCMILVDKSLRIESMQGAKATVLDATDDTDRVVRIVADDVTFGRRGKGFTLVAASDDNDPGAGLVVANGVTGAQIGGNLATNNRGDGFRIRGEGHELEYNHAIDNDSDGFRILASDTTLAFNQAAENDDDGFDFRGDDILATRNAATANLGDGFATSNGARHTYDQNLASANDVDGFFAGPGGDGGHMYTRNVSTGNVFCGFFIRDGSTLQFNAAIGNDDAGVFTAIAEVVITQNNLYGNGEDDNNCGIQNGSGVDIEAPLNFWGAPGGPGGEPRDDVCGDPVDPGTSASSRFGQPFSWLPLD